ncbi:zinc-finger domain-containing protein [Hoeflea sp. TYP-13]|uniref:zinc-finger domain-containing protein n=1 Tax=Hoeflea sp. TYP-13 TaxID=3230023 RepID=UPI0034C5F30C
MAGHTIPHFQNDAGHPSIEVGVREFMCVGANTPFDHPHEYLDMGDDNEIICPYCSTLYKHNGELAADQTQPDGCTFSTETD